VAVFVRVGGYGSPHEFSRGFSAALIATALCSLAGAAMGLRLRGRMAPQVSTTDVQGVKA
jgi:hypothetical protein